MTIFKNYTFTWWQVGLLKFALLFVGIAVGSYWSTVLAPFALHFLVVGIALGLYIKYVGFKQ